MKSLTPLLAASLIAAGVAGCSMTPREAKGTFVGGATGAAVGAVATKSVGGAAVGGGLGALVGNYLGRNAYRCQKVGIFGQPYVGWCLRK